MTVISLRQARDHLGDIVRRARYSGEPTVITDNGTESAVIVSLEDWHEMQSIIDAADAAYMARMRAERSRRIPLDQMLEMLGVTEPEIRAA